MSPFAFPDHQKSYWESVCNAVDFNRPKVLQDTLAHLPPDAPSGWDAFLMSRILGKNSARLATRLLEFSPTLVNDPDLIEKAAMASAWDVLPVLLAAGAPPPTQAPSLGFTLRHGTGMRKTWAEATIDALGAGQWPHLESWCPGFLLSQEVAERLSELLFATRKNAKGMCLAPEHLNHIARLDLPENWPRLVSEELGGVARSEALDQLLGLPDPSATVCHLMELGWIDRDSLEVGMRIGSRTEELRQLIAQAQAQVLSVHTPSVSRPGNKSRL